MSYDLERVRLVHDIAIAILEQQERTILSQPLGGQAISLGIVLPGDQRKEAVTKIEVCFRQMRETARQGAIINLCGTFERMVLVALGTSIGELRKAIKDGYKIQLFSQVKERILKGQSAFESLESQFALSDGYITSSGSNRLARIRKHRNEIAHGLRPLTEPEMSVDYVQIALRETLKFYGIE